MSAVATPDARIDPPLARPDYRLQDNLWAAGGSVFLTGTQALVRLLLMQRQRDAAGGLEHARLRQRLPRLAARHGRPGDLEGGQRSSRTPASASCRRSTRSSPRPRCWARSASSPTPSARCDGVFAMWYGKGPGVDRAGDALKHGNAYGSSPHGGVLVVAGDDHGCVSSSMPHQSDQAVPGLAHADRRAGQRGRVPRVRPVRLGAVALTPATGSASPRCRRWWRAARRWTSMRSNARVAAWHDADAVRAATGHAPPARRPALPLARPADRCASSRACTTSWTRCAHSRASTRSTAT